MLSEQPNPVRGQGGGLADMVPAEVIDPKTGETKGVAKVAEGEFVIPADVVSMLGDGSSEAGARILQSLIEDVRMAKQGNTEQAKSIMEEMIG